MSNLTQEQYDAEYDAEMARLNGQAAATAAITQPEEVPAPEPEPAPEPKPEDPPAPAPVVDEAPETPREKELRERLERTEKSLNDTKRWANEARVETKRLQKEQEERDRKANRPQIFDDNPGLEEAIRYAVPSPAPAPAAQQQDDDSVATWADTVGMALPDLDALLETNATFRDKASAKAKELGQDWLNPIIAIRELTKLQVEQQRVEAQEQARKDFQLKGKKQTAMQVPGGGSGGNRAPAPVDEAERIRTMSSADFEAMRAKALGF